MSTLKNLKLTLLATSILFFPKAGHTMDDQAMEEPRSSFCSLLPASSSNQFPTAPASPSLEGPEEMNRLFGRRFVPNNEIKERLDLLIYTSPTEFQEVTESIRTQLVKKFTPSITYSSTLSAAIDPAIDPLVQSSLQDVVSFALTLSKEEIEKRSKELIRTIIDLNKAAPNRRTAMPAFLSQWPQTEESYDLQLSKQVRRTPNLIYFFKDLLELDPNQIIQRTEAIKKYASFILPSVEDIFISQPENEERAFYIIGSLLKLQTEDIVNRAQSMAKLLSFYRDPSDTYNNPIKVAASHLNNDELALRVDRVTSILSNSPALTPIAEQLSYFSVKFEPADFDSFVSLIKENQESLVPWLQAQSFKYSPIFNFSFEEIRGRIAAIKDGSGPASSSSS